MIKIIEAEIKLCIGFKQVKEDIERIRANWQTIDVIVPNDWDYFNERPNLYNPVFMSSCYLA